MAFCCSSHRMPAEEPNRWKTRRLATAATEITNILTKPGDMVVPGPAGFDSVPRSSAGPLPTSMGMAQATHVRSRMDAQDSSYFADLSKPSPAADAPPNERRVFSTPRSSTQPSPYSSASSSFKGGSLRDEHGQELEAWKRSVEAHHHELSTCLAHLESAIKAEDYQRASRLKIQRDKLMARSLPPKPEASRKTAAGPALSHAPERWTTDGKNSSYSSMLSSTATVVPEGRAESSGLDFLFNVWSHNPQHTPTPTNVHA